MKITKLVIALPLVAALSAVQPTVAPARTKTVLKYGAIGLGAAAIYNLGQRSAYQRQGYYTGNYGYYPAARYCSRPHYGYGYGYGY